MSFFNRLNSEFDRSKRNLSESRFKQCSEIALLLSLKKMPSACDIAKGALLGDTRLGIKMIGVFVKFSFSTSFSYL